MGCEPSRRARPRVTVSAPCLLGACCCCLLALPRIARADINVVVNLQGASGLDPLAVSLAQYRSLSQMDNSDLLVTPCAPGTFSPEHRGVCGPCTRCNVTQYALPRCVPYADAVCNDCDVCSDRQYEYCPCSPELTAQCYLGNRICLPLTPTTLRLTLLLQSEKPLSVFQIQLIQAGVTTGYLEWLLVTFGITDAYLETFTTITRSHFSALFVFPELYNNTLVGLIKNGTIDFYEKGMIYTFGNFQRRRLLTYSSSLVRIVSAFSDCINNQTCQSNPYLQYDGSNCTGQCLPLPCPPGYTGDFGICSPCANATYKAAQGNATCSPCPQNYSSPMGSNSSANCFYFGPPLTTPATSTAVDTTLPTPTATTSAAGPTVAPNATNASASNPGASLIPSTPPLTIPKTSTAITTTTTTTNAPTPTLAPSTVATNAAVTPTATSAAAIAPTPTPVPSTAGIAPTTAPATSAAAIAPTAASTTAAAGPSQQWPHPVIINLFYTNIWGDNVIYTGPEAEPPPMHRPEDYEPTEQFGTMALLLLLMVALILTLACFLNGGWRDQGPMAPVLRYTIIRHGKGREDEREEIFQNT